MLAARLIAKSVLVFIALCFLIRLLIDVKVRAEVLNSWSPSVHPQIIWFRDCEFRLMCLD